MYSFRSALGLLIVLYATTAAQAQDLVVKIGHAGPLSGNQAVAGKDNERGVQLAVDELNATDFRIGQRKTKFVLESEDDQGDPKTGMAVAQKFIDSGVKVVIGHYNSGVSVPASRLYNDANVLMISPASTNPRLTQQGFGTIFRLTANDNVMGAAMAKFAANRNVKKVAIIDDRTAYGAGVAEIFKKTALALGLDVVAYEYTTDKATDFSAILTSIKGKGPDAIFLGGYYAQAAMLARQMKQLNVPGLLLGGDGLCTAEAVTLGASALEGRYFCAQGGEALDTLPGGVAFRERFKMKFGADIDAYAPGFYVATLAVAQAMKDAGSDDPAKVVTSMKTLKINTLLGPVQFDSSGEWVNPPVTMYQIAGGKLSPLERK
jgi:branched-chain amino acid transport system substrate-binding protein